MVDQRLIEYTRTELARGTPMEQIRQVLLAQGWQAEDIAQAVNAASYRSQPAYRAAPASQKPQAQFSLSSIPHLRLFALIAVLAVAAILAFSLLGGKEAGESAVKPVQERPTAIPTPPTETKEKPRCSFEKAGLMCSYPTPPIIEEGTGKLKGTLLNGFGKPIELLQVACTADRSRTPSTSDLTVADGTGKPLANVVNLNRPAGVQEKVSFEEFGVVCTGTDGESAVSLKKGDQFKGRVYLRYRIAGDSVDSKRMMLADLIADVQ